MTQGVEMHRPGVPRTDLPGYVAGFLTSLNQVKPETSGTYQRALREFVKWTSSHDSLEFTASTMQRYKGYLVSTRRLSEASVSTYLTAVRRLCDFLVSEGILAENPAKLVAGGKRPTTHSRETLSLQDVTNLLGSVDQSDNTGKRDYAVVKLMLSCGLSEIEIVRANCEDLQSREGTTILYVQGKGRSRKDQAVVIPADVGAAITAYMMTREDVRPSDPLVASAGNRTRGMRMTTRGIRNRVNGYLEAAGIKKGRMRRITPYSLRHTSALIMADAGASPDEIRQRMRLGTLATAMLYLRSHKTLPTRQKS